jgi:aspartate racemase
MRHVGLLAHSADGAALCFLELVRESARRLGEHLHPEITLSLQPMAPVLEAYERGELRAARTHLTRTASRLAAAGCEFFACPDNTAHLALEEPGEPLPLPGLHIADLVARRAKADGRRCVGLLGTRWTMTGPAYPRALTRAGLALKVPPEEAREAVNRVIFEELCQGVIREDSRAMLVRTIRGLERDGCDVVALSCTELPLIVRPDDSPLPTLDSTRLLARAAVEVAVGEAPLPNWRGGALA